MTIRGSMDDKPHKALSEYVDFLNSIQINKEDKKTLKKLLQKFLDAYIPYRKRIFVEKFIQEEEEKVDQVLKGYLK